MDIENETVTLLPGSRETLTQIEERRILDATIAATARDWDIRTGHRFWLCDELAETLFKKASPGGIMGHRYFDLEEVLLDEIPKSLDELAEQLRQHPWEPT